MRFEKWQALGNDYVIIEAAVLPFELTAGRVRGLCAEHTGVGGDGVLLLSGPDDPGCVARLRIFNPDGSEAELSGNGAREAVLYLRQAGWTDATTFSLQTSVGEVRATILDERTCRLDMGAAKLRSSAYPAGPPRGEGELQSGGRRWSFQHVSIGNPQCAIFVAEDELDQLRLSELGPEIERHALFPSRTNVSFSAVLAPDSLRTRIFERGVGETMASGTGACGAAVAHVLRGGTSPVSVRLDGGELLVDVGENLHVDLTGWAVPVFAGELAKPLIEELHATE
ncbi:MAG: diaminopimelate epimerase [Solirubrobacteraceae bacterium]|nr:MAG: diaminopimelate epimerase [Solirubrobacterales bacterium]